jgi:hypothetical protein
MSPIESPASRTPCRETSVQIPSVLFPSGERVGFISPIPVIAAARFSVTTNLSARILQQHQVVPMHDLAPVVVTERPFDAV